MGQTIIIEAQGKLPPGFLEELGRAFDAYGLVAILVTGVVLGLLAKLLTPGEKPIPLWLTFLGGIFGAVIGTVIAALFGIDTEGIDWLRHALQVAGAIADLVVLGSLWSMRKDSTPAA